MEAGETTPENTTPVDETEVSDEQLENVHGGEEDPNLGFVFEM